MKKIILPLDEIWKLHGEKVCFSSDFNEKAFDFEWQILRDGLRETLGAQWRESCYGDADFTLSDDRTNTWAQAGGIHNEQMLSSEFSKLIFNQLAKSAYNEKWGVLFRVDVTMSGGNGATLKGQFLFKKSIIYVAEYKDYEALHLKL